MTDPRGNVTGFTFDLLNRRTRKTYADGSHHDWTYDAVGNLTGLTTPGGQVMAATFDNRNRLTVTSWSDGVTPTVTRTYDGAGRLLTLNSQPSTLSYSYDSANQLASETQAVFGQAACTVGYTYNEDGDRASLSYPGGSAIGYTYTSRNELSSVTADGPPPLASYAYDLAGRRASKSLENGTTTSYTYDDANRLVSLDHNKVGVSFAKFDYAYNVVSNRTSRTETNTGVPPASDAYTYDAVDQVAGVAYASGRSVGYFYDPMGNRTNVTDTAAPQPESASYTANNLNQYTLVDGNTPTYDLNGNLTSNRSVSGLIWTYTYDARNRLLSASSVQSAVTFTYDARDRCVSRTINGTAIFLTYDSWSLIEERDNTGVLQKSYVHGAQTDEVLAVIRTTLPSPVFYHQDGLGNVTSLTDSAGGLLERYTYNAFGAPTLLDANGAPLSRSSVGNRLLFTGREWVAEVSLYDYRNRYYSVELGRWLSNDPIGEEGGLNLYGYVHNNALNQTDAFGLQDDLLSPHAFDNVRKPQPPMDQFSIDLNFCFYQCVGLGDLFGPTLVAAGAPIVEKPFVTAGATKATSIASSTLSKALPQRLPIGVWAPTAARPLASSKVVGRIAGRWVPWAGWALTLKDFLHVGGCICDCMKAQGH